jgi:hypothetical protein
MSSGVAPSPAAYFPNTAARGQGAVKKTSVALNGDSTASAALLPGLASRGEEFHRQAEGQDGNVTQRAHDQNGGHNDAPEEWRIGGQRPFGHRLAALPGEAPGQREGGNDEPKRPVIMASAVVTL